MPSATVNGKAINRLYEPHSEGSPYNSHGSLKNYQTKGQSYSLNKDDIVSLNWPIIGTLSDMNRLAISYTQNAPKT